MGVDGSAESRLALRWATELSQALGVPLRAVEAWSYPALSVVPGAAAPATPSEMDERTCADIIAVIAEELGDVPAHVQAQALRGAPAGAILQALTPDSLLVLGARGRGGFAGLLLGSVSRECVEHASCPVVVVRAGTPVKTDGPLVVGADGSPTSEESLRWALEVASRLGRETVAVHAWESEASEVPPRHHERLKAQARARIEGWAAQVAPDIRTLETSGDPRAKLIEVAGDLDASLLVVGRRGTSRLRGVSVGGVTSYLLRHSTTPVAVLPPCGAAPSDSPASPAAAV